MTQLNYQTGYRIDQDVVVITSDYPPVNALGHGVRSGISQGIAKALADDGVKAIVLRCAGRTFYAGADITEFGKPMVSPVLREIAIQMEAADKPVVAAIHGTALGGGLETALACHWRIADPAARLGVPEVKLGILAGAGGTQRLPRLVGVAKALEMTVSGDPIGACEALSCGLIDALAEGDLEADAIAFARQLGKRPDRLRRVRDMPVEAVSPDFFSEFRATWADRIEGFEAPEGSIRCAEAASTMSFDDGMKFEREVFEELMAGAQSAAQRYCFFGERAAAKIPGAESGGEPITSAIVEGEGAEDVAAMLRDGGLSANVKRSGEFAKGELILTGSDCSHQVRLASKMTDMPLCTVRFGPTIADARVMEILSGPMLNGTDLGRLLALAKRIGLAVVVTRTGARTLGQRITSRAFGELRNLEAAGTSLADVLSECRTYGLNLGKAEARPRNPEVVAARSALVLAMIDEGVRMLEEGAALRASDIDLACTKLGLWKAYLGGPMFHADELGLNVVGKQIAALRKSGEIMTERADFIGELVRRGSKLREAQGIFDG